MASFPLACFLCAQGASAPLLPFFFCVCACCGVHRGVREGARQSRTGVAWVAEECRENAPSAPWPTKCSCAAHHIASFICFRCTRKNVRPVSLKLLLHSIFSFCFSIFACVHLQCVLFTPPQRHHAKKSLRKKEHVSCRIGLSLSECLLRLSALQHSRQLLESSCARAS